jgi:PAS domain S-box-containing protein
MVVMCAWVFDLALSAVLNAGRFDLGFYVGRIYGLLAATFVLIVLLLETGSLYTRLAHLLATERRKREVEELHRIFDISVDLILVTDRHGDFIRVSPSSATLLGYDPEEMIGHSATEFIYTDDLDPTRNEMRLARRGQQTRHFETQYVHKDGHLGWRGRGRGRNRRSSTCSSAAIRPSRNLHKTASGSKGPSSVQLCKICHMAFACSTPTDASSCSTSITGH